MEHNHMLAQLGSRTLPPMPANLDQKRALVALDQRQQQTCPPGDDFSTLPPLDPSLKLPLHPPPSYSQVRPDAELAPIQPHTGLHDDYGKAHTLPSLSALAGPPPRVYSPSAPAEPSYAPPAIPEPPRQTTWPSLNPFSAYYVPSHADAAEVPLRLEPDSTNSSVTSAASPMSTQDGRASSVSLDDPDVRLAAEALGDLRADFVSSPPDRTTPLPTSPRSHSDSSSTEPLLSLLTTQHPFVGQVIEGTASAYNASKNFSPRFRSSAEYVEGYVTPIANTVGTVGRATGVEGSVRWFLGGGRRTKSDLEDAEQQSASKRRRVDSGVATGEDEPMGGAETPRPSLDPRDPRRLSIASTVDTLPAYDEQRSPAYTENAESRPTSAAWQSRLIMSTSGLSIAMSEESLRSLKYCLGWLRWANEHIGNVVDRLKAVMERYERPSGAPDHGSVTTYPAGADGGRELADKVATLRADVLKTLQDVIKTVSRYAGGALPENARILVRRHLTSLPQRFMVANMVGDGQQHQQADQTAELSAAEAGAASEKEAREGAQRVLVLAKEGLDMMAQVSGVLDGTIESAEEWCDRLGRKRREQRESLAAGGAESRPYDGDKMETR